MRDKLTELLIDGHKQYLYYDQIADHLLANGVIVPPCKVGDTVWLVYTPKWPANPADNGKWFMIEDGVQRMDDKIKELTEENEKLNEEIRVRDEIIDYRGSEVLRHDKCIRTLHKEIELIKEEVVQKFADYLKEHSFTCDPGNWLSFEAIDVDELDDYVKRFLEEYDG